MALRSFIRLLLPYRPTTGVKAREAIVRCGISPDDIAWAVTRTGMFTFGRKSPSDPPLTEGQTECLLQWARENRVQVQFIGWEAE